MESKQLSKGSMDVAGKSYQLKFSVRALILFEKMVGKPFTLACTTDWVVFLYAMLLTGTPDATITLDEFMDGISQVQLREAIAWADGEMDPAANTEKRGLKN